MGKIVKGFWNCKHCGTTKISGGLRECPNCGKARDINTIFYLDRNHITYVSETEAAHISRNPDWICRHCNQLNSDNNKHCVSCGAPRTKENLNYFENLKKNEEKQKNTSSSIDDYPKENLFSLKTFLSLHMYPVLITFLALICVTGLIFLFIPKEQDITVQEMSWQRCIDIEKYQAVQESGWSLPSEARLLYSQEEFSHYEQVLDHYETKTRQVEKKRISGYEEYVSGYRDLGNGYFEEITSTRPIYETYYETETYQEPVYRNEAVYQTKYYYEIDKWLYERSIKTTGNDKNPYWGDVTLASNERISAQIESYSISGLNEKGKERSISLSYDDWNSLEIGQTVKLKVSLGYGKIVE